MKKKLTLAIFIGLLAFSFNRIQAQTTQLDLDYNLMDDYYSFSSGYQYYQYAWQVNSNYPNDSLLSLSFASVIYDTLINYDYNTDTYISSLSVANSTINLDSFQLYYYHNRVVTNSADEIYINVYDPSQALITGTGPAATFSAPWLWQDSFKISGTQNFNDYGYEVDDDYYELTFSPNLALAAGHTFGIYISFKGDISNYLFVYAGYRDQCNGSCAAEVAYAPENSLYYLNYNDPEYGNNSGINPIYYNCAGQDTLVPGDCEYFYIQNFQMPAYITVTSNTQTPPSVVTTAATGIGSTGATINGTVNANGILTYTSFDWGLTNSYGNTVAGNPFTVTGNVVTPVNYALTGLSPGTTYHYRIYAESTDGTSYGNDMTFTTSAAGAAPIVVTGAATNVASTTATINGTINANGNFTLSLADWGLNANFYTYTVNADPDTITGNIVTPVSYNITGLTPSTTYHYDIADSYTGGIIHGADMTFTTLAQVGAPPTVVTTAATSITSGGATLNGTVNANNLTSSTVFEWGLTSGYGNSVAGSPATVSGSVITPVDYVLNGLSPSTTYHYRIDASSGGGVSEGNDMTFTTSGQGASPCTPQAGVTTGVYPGPELVPCVVQGQAFSQTYTFANPDSVTVEGFTLHIISITIDSVANLPSGLTWQANANPANYDGGTSGCILVSGTTEDACGEYLIDIILNVETEEIGELDGLSTVTFGASQQYLRVISSGHSCPVLDTTQSTAFVSYPTCGGGAISISAVVNTTPVNCYGQSTGSAAAIGSGGNTYTYLWSNGQTTQTISNLPAGTYSVTVTSEGATASASGTVTQPASAVAVGVSTTTTSCSGNTGTASVSASGGTPGYTYLWSNGQTSIEITGLAAGAYPVTATDTKGCTASNIATVSSNASFTISVTPTDINCYGASTGQASVIATGAVGSVTYLWSNGNTTATATNLSAGSVTVTVTNAGCAQVGATIITQPSSAVSVNASSESSSCISNTGSATALATGGTPGYTYLWSNAQTSSGITGLGVGTYSVTAYDTKGCSATNSVSVTSPATFNITVTDNNILCFGSNTGSATVSTSGTQGTVLYSWSNNATTATITDLGPGSYNVTVTDGSGCSKTGSGTVTQPASGISVTATETATSCTVNSGTATATAANGAPNYNYLWSSGATTAEATGLAAGVYFVTATDAHSCTASTFANVTSPASFTLNASGTDVICYGASTGSASATVTGAAGTVNYVWNNGATTASISGLQAGTYIVTASDASGCAKTASTTLTQPSVPLVATASSTQSTCSSSTGTATVTVTGNNGGVTYLWSNGSTSQSISNLGEGLYIVTISAGGCSDTTSVAVNNSNGPSLTLLKTNPTCFNSDNGSISASVTGGSQPYTFLWSTGGSGPQLQNQGAGTYTVIVTDNSGCQATQQTTLIQPDALTFNSTTNNVTCNGAGNGSIILQAGGGTGPYSYLWSKDNLSNSTISNLSGGIYTVTVTDSKSCTAVDQFTVIEPAALDVSATATGSNNSDNGTSSAAVTGGTPPYNYLWNNSQTTSSINNLAPATYTVTVSDRDGCTGTATATVVSGIGNVSDIISNVTLFPNPASDVLNIIVLIDHTRTLQFNVSDVTGKLIYTDVQKASGNLSRKLDLSAYPSGVYMLEVVADDQQSVRKRFVVTH